MKKALFPLLFLLCPSLGLAHESGHGGGFMGGLTHPVYGLDHFLAMISVGILSSHIGGRARWILPTTFVAAMLVGGILGMNDLGLPYVELGIVVSVAALGVAIAANWKFPMALGMLLIGCFAIFHGHAHGTEMPGSKPTLYACGFLAGAAGLHLAGVFVATIIGGFRYGAQFLRYLGAGIAGIGFHLLYLT